MIAKGAATKSETGIVAGNVAQGRRWISDTASGWHPLPFLKNLVGDTRAAAPIVTVRLRAWMTALSMSMLVGCTSPHPIGPRVKQWIGPDNTVTIFWPPKSEPIAAHTLEVINDMNINAVGYTQNPMMHPDISITSFAFPRKDFSLSPSMSADFVGPIKEFFGAYTSCLAKVGMTRGDIVLMDFTVIWDGTELEKDVLNQCIYFAFSW